MMLPSTRGISTNGGSSLGRRLQSRRGGGGGGGRSQQSGILISPLVIVAAGTFLAFSLMALGWSILVHHGSSAPHGASTRTGGSSNTVQRPNAAVSMGALRARLHHGYATSTVNAGTKIRHPLLTTDPPLPTPILVMGMPKVGTTSIASYFRCGNVRSSHFSCEVNDDDDLTRPWRNCLLPKGAGGGGTSRSDVGTGPLCAVCIERNIGRGRPPFEGCGSYDVFGEMDSAEHPLPLLREDDDRDNDKGDNVVQPLCSFPQITHLDKIHESYPNATFILNTRPVDHWIKSISNWNPTPNRADKGYLRRVLAMCDLGTDLRPGVGETDEELTKFYLGHSERIRNFVRDHPSHALVEVDIEDFRAGEIMQNAFGINKQCWGKQNAATPGAATQLNGTQNNGGGDGPMKQTSPRILGQPQGDVHVATSTTRNATRHNLTSAMAASQAQADLLFAQYSAQKAYNAEMALDYPYCSDIEDIFPRSIKGEKRAER